MVDFSALKDNKFVKKALPWVHSFQKYYQQGDVGNNSIVLAYYFLMSLAPLILVLGNLFARLNLDTSLIMNYLRQIAPKEISQMIGPAIRSFLTSGSNTSLSIGILVTIWSASGIIATLRNCLNQIYEIKNPQNTIISRIISFLLLLAALLLLIFSIFLLLFGQYLVDFFNLRSIPSLAWIVTIINEKDFIAFFSLFLIAALIFIFVSQKRPSLRYVWVGALFSALIWLLFTNGFQLYINYFARKVTSYKTIGSIIILMLWLNLSSWIILAGAVINAVLENHFKTKK